MSDRDQHRRLTLNVGVTGHREIRLTPMLMRALPPVIDEVLSGLCDSARRLQAAEPAESGNAAPALWLHSALATGADQLAASSARGRGYKIHAVLPFTSALYRDDFAPGVERAAFDRQLADADSSVVLSCEREEGDGCYVRAGRAIIDAADVMIAVWDGDDGDYAQGGTAHVVALAAEVGVPVIHIAVDRAASRVGPVMLRDEGGGRQLSTDGAYDALLRAVMGMAVRRRLHD